MLLAATLAVPSRGSAFTLDVVDPAGQPVAGFRYLVEEDTTYEIVPAVASLGTPTVNIHKTYAPVVTEGLIVSAGTSVALPADKRYFVSVMPFAGHTIGGTTVAAGQADVRVVVAPHPVPHPVPTAQISIYAFHDNHPHDAAPDIPAEEGLAGFTVVLFDFAGAVSVGAFGNTLGTTYGPDGEVLEMGSGVIVIGADAGGGIALDDAARVFLIHDTIAHKDSTATGVDAFGGPCEEGVPPYIACEFSGGLITSVPQVAGLASPAHSLGPQAAFGPGVYEEFANPVLRDVIFWQNRSFYWDAAYDDGWGGLRPDIEGGEAPVFWDLQVYGTIAPALLNPRNCLLTVPGGYHASNVGGDPRFVDPYFITYLATSGGAAFGNSPARVRLDRLPGPGGRAGGGRRAGPDRRRGRARRRRRDLRVHGRPAGHLPVPQRLARRSPGGDRPRRGADRAAGHVP